MNFMGEGMPKPRAEETEPANEPETNEAKKTLGMPTATTWEISQMPALPKHYGTYAVNNEMIAFANSEGMVSFAPNSQARIEELRQLGYTESGLGVPYSNEGGMPPPGSVERTRFIDTFRDELSYDQTTESWSTKKV